MIPILRVADAAAAVDWYEHLGFVKQWEHRFEPGFPAFAFGAPAAEAPWAREIELRDPDGNRLRVGTPAAIQYVQ